MMNDTLTMWLLAQSAAQVDPSADAITLLRSAWEHLGWYGVVPAAVIVLIRLYRLPTLQAALERSRFRKASWARLNRYVRVGLVGALSLGGALLSGMASGSTIWAALLASIPITIAAMLGHETTKAVGYLHHEISTAKDPTYTPSPFREVASLAFPLDRSKLPQYNEGKIGGEKPGAK